MDILFNFCLVFVMLYIMAERHQDESLFTPQIAMSVRVYIVPYNSKIDDESLVIRENT